MVLSDQKNNTQKTTNSDKSSKENGTPAPEEIKRNFDDDLCNQVDQLLNPVASAKREIIQIPPKQRKLKGLIRQFHENKQIRCRTETPENLENWPVERVNSPSKILKKHMER